MSQILVFMHHCLKFVVALHELGSNSCHWAPVPCSDYPTFQDAWECLPSWGSHVAWYVGIAEAWTNFLDAGSTERTPEKMQDKCRLFIFRSKVFLRCNLSWAHCDWIVQVTIHDPSINKLSQVHRAQDIPIIGTDNNYPCRLCASELADINKFCRKQIHCCTLPNFLIFWVSIWAYN